MDPIVVRKDEARTFYEGPELCREYHVTEKITFGSSTLQPGETGDIDLGHPASHGCIRCCVADAKFIYDYCNGARVTIFDGVYTSKEVFKGPLGRNPLVPKTSGADPTDPLA